MRAAPASDKTKRLLVRFVTEETALLAGVKRSLGSAAFGAAGILAFAAFALAASAVSKPRAGVGSGAISGYQVSRVAYTSSGGLLTGVSFDLDAPATRVGVRLDSTGGSWYECGASAVTSPFSVSCAVSLPVDEADSLTVAARQ